MNRRARRTRPPRAWPSSCFSHTHHAAARGPPWGRPTTLGHEVNPSGFEEQAGRRREGCPSWVGKTLSFFPFVAFSLNVYFPPRSMNWNMWGFNLVSPWFTRPVYHRGKSLLVDDKKQSSPQPRTLQGPREIPRPSMGRLGGSGERLAMVSTVWPETQQK